MNIPELNAFYKRLYMYIYIDHFECILHLSIVRVMGLILTRLSYITLISS